MTPASAAELPQLYSASLGGVQLLDALNRVGDEARDVEHFLSFTPQKDPLVWAQGASWALGAGRVVYVEAGENRWHVARALAAALPRGARAFSAFTFDALAGEPSVCIVPEYLLLFDGTELTLTQVATHRLADCADALAYARRALAEPLGAGVPVHLRGTQAERTRHMEAVRAATQQFATGNLAKVVLARRAWAHLPEGYDLRPVLARLHRRFTQCVIFAVDGFFGASPETLLHVERSANALHATSRVLAGTLPAGGEASTLLRDTKELTEHEYAAQSAVEAMSEHCGNVRCEGPHLLELPNVWHLASDISGDIESDVFALLRSLHPTAAVAGVPRALAFETINRLEAGASRGRYAGPVGCFSGEEGTWALGLRSAQIRGRELEAWAGGGIVPGSVPEKEYQETEAKLSAIATALAAPQEAAA